MSAPVEGSRTEAEIATDLTTVEEWRGRWDSLYAAAGSTNPFLSHTWVMAWLRNFRQHYRTPVVLWVEGDDFRGVAPLVLRTRHFLKVPYRSLELFGDDDAGYKGFLVEGNAEAFVRAFFDHALADFPGWDALLLNGLVEEDGWHDAIPDEATRRGFSYTFAPAIPTFRLALPDDYEELLAELKGKFRRNMGRRSRQAEEQGLTVDYRAGEALREEDLLEARSIEQKSWKGEQGIGIFHDEPHLGLQTDLAADPAAPFRPEILFLRDGERAVAFQYGYYQQGCYFSYNTAYEAETEHSRLSPGILLLEARIEALIDEGGHTVDLLVGDVSYKRDWTAEPSDVHRLVVYRPTLRGSLLHGLRSLRERVRRRAEE